MVRPTIPRDNQVDIEVGHCVVKKGYPTEILIRRGQRRMQYPIKIRKQCWVRCSTQSDDSLPSLAARSFSVGDLSALSFGRVLTP